MYRCAHVWCDHAINFNNQRSNRISSPTIPTESYKFTEARPQLSELLNRVFRREARMLIKKGGLPVAAIVSVDDLDRLNRLDAERDSDFRVFDEVGAAFSDQTPEQIERGTAHAVTEARAEIGAERKTLVHP